MSFFFKQTAGDFSASHVFRQQVLRCFYRQFRQALAEAKAKKVDSRFQSVKIFQKTLPFHVMERRTRFLDGYHVDFMDVLCLETIVLVGNR